MCCVCPFLSIICEYFCKLLIILLAVVGFYFLYIIFSPELKRMSSMNISSIINETLHRNWSLSIPTLQPILSLTTTSSNIQANYTKILTESGEKPYE